MPEWGVRCSDALSAWSAIAHECIRVVEAYIAAVPGDAPYGYGERTSVGLLAAAVWRSGGVALQDYRYDPCADWSSAKREWGDLSAVIDGLTFLVECKVDWYLEGSGLPAYRERLKDAKSEAASKIQVPNAAAFDPDAARRLAVVFSSPETPESQDDSGFRTKLRALNDMFEVGELDLVAWCTPYSALDSFKSMPTQRTWYPGMIITIKEVSRKGASSLTG